MSDNIRPHSLSMLTKMSEKRAKLKSRQSENSNKGALQGDMRIQNNSVAKDYSDNGPTAG